MAHLGCKTKRSIVFSGSTFLGLLFCNSAAPLGGMRGRLSKVLHFWRWGGSRFLHCQSDSDGGRVALFTDVRPRNKAWIIDAALCRAGNISGNKLLLVILNWLLSLLRFSLSSRLSICICHSHPRSVRSAGFDRSSFNLACWPKSSVSFTHARRMQWELINSRSTILFNNLD